MYTWEELKQFVDSCSRCPLCRTRNRSVMGRGSLNAGIMFIAEAPGRQEDLQGIPFVGTSPLVSGEIAEDVSAYFLTSEQRPTAVALGVRIGADGRCVGAGGVFLQPLPGAGEDALDFVQARIAEYANLSSVIEQAGVASVVSAFDAKDVSVRDVRFCCHCSRERAASAVLSMGREDAFDLLRERGTICVHCHYCNTDYTFDEDDLRKLFGESA